MALSHGLAGMGGAAAGAAAVGGYVYLKGIADQYSDAKSEKRLKAIETALRRSLGRRNLNLPSIAGGGVVAASLERLQCDTPVVQVQSAFDAILDYQQRRGKDESNPKTLVCELLKTWLREHAMDRNLAAKEVQAYRDFCREMVYDKEPWRGGFLSRCQFTSMLANVQVELDKLLAVRLRDDGDVRKLFDDLKVDAYYYLLRATQVLLLSATTFTVPDGMYAMSLESLKQSAINPILLKDAADRDVAKDLNKAWQSDACRLLRAFLEQPHVVAITLEQVGPKGAQKVLPHTTRVIEVLSALRLPDRPTGVDTVDPYVRLKVTKVGNPKEMWWEAKSCTKENCSDPEWNEIFFVDLPEEGWELVLEVVDDNGGSLMDTTFAKTDVLGKDQVLKDQELTVPLQSNGTFCRDVSASSLLVRFRALNFQEELQAVRLREPVVTGSKTCRSSRRSSAGPAMGLKFTDLGPKLSDAVESLEHAAYFLDLARQAAELTKLMGDMGAVLLEDKLQLLLQDVNDKVQAFQQKATQLEDAVADHTMSEERRRKSLNVADAAKRLFGSTSASDSRARQSSDDLQRMQTKIEETVASLKKELSAFKGVKDVFDKAKDEADQLVSRLGSAETQKRSGRTVSKSKSKLGWTMSKLSLGGSSTREGSASPTSPTSPTSGYAPSKSAPCRCSTWTATALCCGQCFREVEVFEAGDKVQILSASQGVWYYDGVVEEVLPRDTADGPKNSLRIRYASGERQKWVKPEEFESMVQRAL